MHNLKLPNMRMVLLPTVYHPHSDPRRYNVPTGNEIAVILPGDNITEDDQNIVVQLRGGSFQRVYDTNLAYC